MSLLDKIKTQIQNLINTANEKTGNTDTDLTSAVTALVSGYGQNSGHLECFNYLYSLQNVFYTAIFPENAEVYIEPKNPINKFMTDAFTGARNVKKIKIKADFVEYPITVNNTFRNCQTLEEIDVSEMNFQFINGVNTFNGSHSLKRIIGVIDFSKAINVDSFFNGCISLEEVRFKENSLSVSISLSSSSLLSDEAIQSIIDGLAIVETTQTIKFHADVKAKLTEAQISQITSKNWTLA